MNRPSAPIRPPLDGLREYPRRRNWPRFAHAMLLTGLALIAIREILLFIRYS